MTEKPPVECEHNGCKETATHYPCVNLPRIGVSLESHQPMHLVLSYALCERHAAGYTVKEALPGKSRKRMVAAMRVKGQSQQIDFDRAFITAEPMNSRRALMFSLVGGLDKHCNPIKKEELYENLTH